MRAHGWTLRISSQFRRDPSPSYDVPSRTREPKAVGKISSQSLPKGLALFFWNNSEFIVVSLKFFIGFLNRLVASSLASAAAAAFLFTELSALD